MPKKIIIFFLCYFTILHKTYALPSDDIDFNQIEEYDGPQIESEDIETIYSENAKLKAKIKAKISQQYKNKDIIYPEGIFVEFYDDAEEIKGTLRADYVKYTYKDKKYHIRGNVEVINKGRDEKLKTTELTWLPDEKKIFTERFVEIVTKDINLIGKGIDADEDFGEYKILEPHGIIKISKSQENLASRNIGG